MRIRCRNCYRLLNNDEEWCTRCGAHSAEIEEILKSGVVPVDEKSISNKSLLFYLLIAFIINGILSVIFGVVFNAMHQDIYLGDETTLLPTTITYFSSINSLLVSSIICLGVELVVNVKDLKTYLKFTLNKKTIITLIVGVMLTIGLVFLFKYTPLTITPTYFKEYLMNPTNEMKEIGTISVFKIISILILYMLVEELVFRKAFINFLDQTTVMSDATIIILQSIVSTVFMVLCYLLLVKTTLINYVFFIIANLVVNALLGISYFVNDRSIVSNIIFRLLFIIAFVIIL